MLQKGRNIAHYIPSVEQPIRYPPGSTEYMHRIIDIHDSAKHSQLRQNLADHIYSNRDPNANIDDDDSDGAN